MPNTKSAIKRIKTSEKSRLRNMANKRRLNTARRTFVSEIASGDAASKKEAFRKLCSAIDKATKHKTISENAAARRKSRAYAKIAGLNTVES